MNNDKELNEILNFAIQSEQDAHDLYMRLSNRSKNPAIGKMFAEFAAEELGHKAKLTRVKEGKQYIPVQSKPVTDLKISDYIVTKEPDPDADYQSVLLYAMQKEKAAFRLYTDLAGRTDRADIRELLLGLAQEEAKHKLRFEVEYDENVLTEN